MTVFSLTIFSFYPFGSSDVRSKAFQAVEQFLQLLKQYHDKVRSLIFNAFDMFCLVSYMIVRYK